VEWIHLAQDRTQ